MIFRIKIDKRFQGVPGKIFFGSSLAFVHIIFNQDIVSLFLIPVFLLCGVISFLLYLFLQRNKLLLGLFLFLFSIGILVAVHTPFLLLIFPYSRIFYHSGYIAFYFAWASFFYLISLVVIEKHKRVINFIWKFKVACLFLVIPVFSFTNLMFIDIMKYEIILDILLAVTAFVYLFLSIRKNRLQRNIFIIALTLVIISIIVELLIIFGFGFRSEFGYRIRVFHFGAIIFVSALIWLVYNNYMGAQREKEMVRRNEFEAVKRENIIKHNFTVKLLESQEAERNRIALELHDSIGQKLILIKNQLLEKIKNSSEEQLTKSLDAISRLTGETINEVRSITHNLRPPFLDQLGIKAAIEFLIEQFEETSAITFNYYVVDIDKMVNDNDKINFFRIVQESLNNIIKHSQATEAFIKITNNDKFITLEIKDNGIGIEADNIYLNRGIGLTGMKERANQIDADLKFINNDSGGTTIKMEYKINRGTTDELSK